MRMNLSNSALTMLALLPAWIVVGCAAPAESLPAKFQNADPQVRIEAIREAGQTRNTAAVPYLIDRLSDSQADIRLFAIMALRDITGQTHGYNVYEPAPQRAAAIARWRQWLSERSGSVAATQPAAGAK